MTDFSKRLRVPVVGGHTLITEGNPFVSLAILGKARKIITSFDANPGDRMALIYNPDGKWMDDLGFWNSLPSRSGPEHIEDLELIPQAAESELVQAGKDVSMSGIIGTALMFVEASGVGARIDLDCIPMPEGVHPGRWLLAYFSYGFLLAVSEERWGQVVDLFSLRSLEVRQIGSFCEGSQLVLSSEGRQEALWDWSVEPFLGLQRV
jgi:selenophosphate synthetase-related protein